MSAANKVLLAALFALAPAGARAQAPSDSSPLATWHGAPEAPLWNALAAAALDAHGSALLANTPSDIATYCPNFATLNAEARRTFWVGFLAALANQESTNDPMRVHWRAYDSDVHQPTFRRGLFQIAIESAHRKTYACAAQHGGELAAPEANIECAVRILDHDIAKDHAIARNDHGHAAGGARYWPSLKNESERSAIANETAHLEPCTVPRTHGDR